MDKNKEAGDTILKNIISYFLTFSLLLCSISFNTTIFSDKFNIEGITESIEYLSSDDFGGRLPGTLENAMVATYLKNEFISLGLKPLGDSYYESFQLNYPKRIDGTPYLSIYDGNNALIKDYKYGIDFKESLLNVRSNELSFNNRSTYFSNNFLSVVTDKGTAVIYAPKEDSLNFRSSFMENSKGDLYVQVTESCFKELQSYLKEDVTVKLFIPYEIEPCTLNNVVGVIKGRDSSLAPIVIGAHYDHVGTDLNNTVYNGALDNASGTSFILELARYIKTLGIPDRDVIFVVFNGEEFGLRGSEIFANEYKDLLQGGRVYNFDMIGSDKGVPLCLMAWKHGSVKDPLVNEITNICEEKKIHFNYIFEDSSDHASFSSINVDAITFCDSDMTRIHTPEDTIEYISPTAIERCFSIVKPQLFSDIFKGNPLYNVPKLILATFGLSSLILFTLLVLVLRRNARY